MLHTINYLKMKIKKIDIREIKRELSWAEGNCPYCNKLLRAHDKKLLELNYTLHLDSCKVFKELNNKLK